MGKKDTSGKDLMKRPAEFASALNLAAFEGEEVVELRAEGRAEGETIKMLQIYHNMINANIPEAQARELSGVTDEMLANEKKK